MSVIDREIADGATTGDNRRALVAAEVTPTCTGSKAGHSMMHVERSMQTSKRK